MIFFTLVFYVMGLLAIGAAISSIGRNSNLPMWAGLFFSALFGAGYGYFVGYFLFKNYTS